MSLNKLKVFFFVLNSIPCHVLLPVQNANRTEVVGSAIFLLEAPTCTEALDAVAETWRSR
jgi:hypothetical protein